MVYSSLNLLKSRAKVASWFQSSGGIKTVSVVFSGALYCLGCKSPAVGGQPVELQSSTHQVGKLGAVASPPGGLSLSPGRPWWQDAIIYEIWPRSFKDSNGDGSGDFKGIISKLDYLVDLGVNTIWLTPIFEAPSYHGYDFQEFYKVESDYGTMEDFDELMRAAKQRSIRVIADLVLNHISVESDWFKKSVRREEPFTDFFIWRKDIPVGPWGRPWVTPENPGRGYNKPELVWFKQPDRGEYYYGAFSGSQPDLNLKNPRVIAETNRIANFWYKKGFDGFRLDAARFAVEEGPYPLQADNAGTLEFWRHFRQYIKQQNPNLLLVGELWSKTEVVSRYHDKGLGIDSGFDFDFGVSVIRGLNALTTTDGSFGSVGQSGTEQLPLNLAMRENFNRKVATGVPLSFFAPFLTNHDQTRIMKSLGDQPQKMRIAAALLMTGIGTPYLYYGEEIGMTQLTDDKEDLFRRAPMQWSSEPFAGFASPNPGVSIWVDDAKWFPDRPNHASWWTPWVKSGAMTEAMTVDGQRREAGSLLNWYRGLIRLRKERPELRATNASSYRYIEAGPHIYAYERRLSDAQRTLVLVNFSDTRTAIINEATYKAGTGAGNLKEWPSRNLLTASQIVLPPRQVKILVSEP